MPKATDETDRRILELLDWDGRASLIDIGRAVGLSGPAVGERLRRLQASGVIERFTLRLNRVALGYGLEAIVRIKPRPGQLHLVERMIEEEQRFTDCDKVTGDDCFIVRLLLRSVAELDDILSPMHDRAETHTSIVKSSPLRGRLPQLRP